MTKRSETDWERVDREEPDLSDIPELDEVFFENAKVRLPRDMNDKEV